MKFNSQICTTREQSERLLALGLKKETADMVWRYSNTVKGKDYYDLEAQPCDSSEQKSRWIESCEKADYLSHWFKPDGTAMTAEEVYEAVWGKDIPAWSLHRLIEISKNSRHHKVTFMYDRDLYNDMITAIEFLIRGGQLNKEYLI